MNWSVEFLNEEVQAEFQELPLSLQAHILRIVSLVRESSLEKVGMPYVRHLVGKLWEMRGRGILP